MTLSIRNLTSCGDCKRICSLEKAECKRLYEIEKACFTRKFRWNKPAFCQALRESDVWIAEESNRIVGFLIGEVEDGRGHVATVDVDPKYRGKGIGATLMNAAEEEYKKRGLNEMRLEVHVDNPAQVLYFKLGYRVIGVRQHYYSNGSNAITMAKKMKRG